MTKDSNTGKTTRKFMVGNIEILKLSMSFSVCIFLPFCVLSSPGRDGMLNFSCSCSFSFSVFLSIAKLYTRFKVTALNF